ncbi:MAG: SIS domain-containing protein [Acidimicrobiales bacterium]
MSGAAGGRLDSLGMWEATAALPEQLLEGSALARAHPPVAARGDGGRSVDRVRGVAVLGSGSAGLAGRAVAMVAGPRAAVPVVVVPGFGLPAFVGPGWLVLALSHSGRTDETLVTATAALDAGADLVAVTTGGPLGTLAADAGVPVVGLPKVPQPRVALGAIVVVALVVLERAGLVEGVDAAAAAAAAHLRRRRDEMVDERGRAAAVARRIGGTLPLVYGTDGPAALAAERWKAQVNENAKTPAFSASLPDALHAEAAGWGVHGDVTRQLLTVVSLRHGGEALALARRADALGELLLEVVADVLEVRAGGDGDLACFFDLVLVGDLVSLWLAAAHGVDPGPVPVVDDLSATSVS